MQKYGPLWLPYGSVRAIIALSVLFGVISAMFRGVVVPDAMEMAFGVIIGLYFSQSANAEINNQKNDANQALQDELRMLKAEKNKPVQVPLVEKV